MNEQQITVVLTPQEYQMILSALAMLHKNVTNDINLLANKIQDASKNTETENQSS